MLEPGGRQEERCKNVAQRGARAEAATRRKHESEAFGSGPVARQGHAPGHRSTKVLKPVRQRESGALLDGPLLPFPLHVVRASVCAAINLCKHRPTLRYNWFVQLVAHKRRVVAARATAILNAGILKWPSTSSFRSRPATFILCAPVRPARIHSKWSWWPTAHANNISNDANTTLVGFNPAIVTAAKVGGANPHILFTGVADGETIGKVCASRYHRHAERDFRVPGTRSRPSVALVVLDRQQPDHRPSEHGQLRDIGVCQLLRRHAWRHQRPSLCQLLVECGRGDRRCCADA